MNELIKELAIQAGFRSDVTVSDGQGNHIVTKTEQSLEKFGELIVRECVRYFNEDYTRDFDTLWREDLSKGIKEHFGVKNES
jgi:hypothetical protein